MARGTRRSSGKCSAVTWMMAPPLMRRCVLPKGHLPARHWFVPVSEDVQRWARAARKHPTRVVP